MILVQKHFFAGAFCGQNRSLQRGGIRRNKRRIGHMKRSSIFPLLSKQLVRHEGLCLEAYLDSMGILTVGVGHNCKARPVPGVTRKGDRISHELVLSLLDSDVSEEEADLNRRWPWVEGLDDERYGALVNMIFNMGGASLAKFKKAMPLVECGDYEAAADQFLESMWAQQVGKDAPGSPEAIKRGRPGRAWEVTEQIRVGIWQGVVAEP